MKTEAELKTDCAANGAALEIAYLTLTNNWNMFYEAMTPNIVVKVSAAATLAYAALVLEHLKCQIVVFEEACAKYSDAWEAFAGFIIKRESENRS
jgi:hypothetical protein